MRLVHRAVSSVHTQRLTQRQRSEHTNRRHLVSRKNGDWSSSWRLASYGALGVRPGPAALRRAAKPRASTPRVHTHANGRARPPRGPSRYSCESWMVGMSPFRCGLWMSRRGSSSLGVQQSKRSERKRVLAPFFRPLRRSFVVNPEMSSDRWYAVKPHSTRPMSTARKMRAVLIKPLSCQASGSRPSGALRSTAGLVRASTRQLKMRPPKLMDTDTRKRMKNL
mmetsp:Transcript_5196/g.15367  ORF Transcript_5196/g.15367 Transcript_5196/m.15367 type:complete len:223 (+) Transcript_5196:133-801(+)